MAATLTTLSCAGANLLVRAAPKNAKELYEQSMEDLDDGFYPEALKGFAELKTKYPYTKYAALADVRGADTHFQRGKHLEAVDAYRNFLKFHPNHDQAAYAMLQIGEAYYEQIPGDWFFLPPAAEKDQANTRLAISAYRDSLARFPKHDLTTKARGRLRECRTKLADHELYVANFYLGRDRFEAAAARAEGLLAAYPGLGHDEEALWIAGLSRFTTGEHDLARAHLSRLSKDFPKGGFNTDASTLLQQIGKKTPTAKPAQGS